MEEGVGVGILLICACEGFWSCDCGGGGWDGEVGGDLVEVG